MLINTEDRSGIPRVHMKRVSNNKNGYIGREFIKYMLEENSLMTKKNIYFNDCQIKKKPIYSVNK